MKLELLKKQIIALAYSGDAKSFKAKAHLYQEYCQACRKFNEEVQQCNDLIARKMIWDANTRYAANDPQLEVQAELLNLRKDSKFTDFCQQNEIPLPVALKLEDFKTLKSALAALNDSKQLIDEYRKIGRFGAVSEKVLLLRKIVKVLPDQEWRSALGELEEKWQNELAAEAKKAILGKDFAALEKVEKQLVSPEWSVKPNALIVEKVCKIAQAHRDELTAAQANEKLNAVNEAFSEQNVDKLTTVLRAWKEFAQNNPQYVPDAPAARQLASAQAYHGEQLRIRENTRQCKALLNELVTGLDRGQPLKSLQKKFDGLQERNYQVPEDVLERFRTYKKKAESAARRARTVKIIAAVVTLSVIVISVLGLSIFVVLNQKETRWVTELTQSLTNDKAESSLTMLERLEKESAYIRKRPAILKIEKQINAKKASQDAKRKEFNLLADEIRELLKAANKDADKISRLFVKIQENIIDDKEKTVFDSLQKENETVFREFRMAQNKKYSAAAESVRSDSQLFWKALAADDMKTASVKAEEIGKIIKQLDELKEVTPDVIDKYKDMIVQASEMKYILSYYKKILQSENFYLFKDNIEELLPLLSDPEISAVFKGFLNKEITMGEAMLNSSDVKNIELFQQDAEDLTDAVNDRKDFHTAVAAEVKKRVGIAEKNKMCMVVLRDSDGRLCSLIFPRKPQKVKDSGKPVVYKNAEFMINDNKLQYYHIYDYAPEKNRVVLLNKDWGTIFDGQAVYPEKLHFNSPMIMDKYWIELDLCLSEPGADAKTEAILIDSINRIIADEALHPVPKVTLLKQFTALLCKADYPEYEKYQQAAGKIAGKILKKKQWLIDQDNQSCSDRNKLIKSLNNSKLTPQIEVQISILQTALSRKVQPGGFLYRHGDRYRFVRFGGIPAAGELWTLSESGNFIIAGSYSEKYTFVDIKPDKSFLKLIFIPCDNRSTAELEAQITGKNGNNIQFPASWPLKKKSE